MEVVVNGQAVATQEIEADGTFRDLEFDVPIEQSSWVAVRVYPSSHTNPVFVVVGDEPIRASKKSAEWCLKSVDQCWSQKVKNTRDSELRGRPRRLRRRSRDIPQDPGRIVRRLILPDPRSRGPRSSGPRDRHCLPPAYPEFHSG